MLCKIISNKQPGCAEQAVVPLLTELGKSLAVQKGLRALAAITGNITTETTRYIYHEENVSAMLHNLGIPEAYALLFEEPRIKRKGYCRLKPRINGIKTMARIIGGLARNYQFKHQTAKLQKALWVYNLLSAQSVNTELRKNNEKLLKQEKQLINYLNNPPAEIEKVSYLSLGKEPGGLAEPNKPAKAFLFALMRFFKLQEPLIRIRDGFLPGEVIFYENVYSGADLLQTFAELKLEQKSGAGTGRSLLEVFFETVGAGKVIPRWAPLNEQLFNQHFAALLHAAPDAAQRDNLLSVRKDFKEYYKELQEERAQELFEQLKASGKARLREDVNNFIQRFYFDLGRLELQRGLQKGWGYARLNYFIEQTDFAARGRQTDVRGKIEEMYRAYFRADGSGYYLPVPELEYLDQKLHGPLPDRLAAFWDISYPANPLLAEGQELAKRQLAALYLLYTNPSALAEYRELLRNKNPARGGA
ncbi:MAG: hypothetical protein LBQ83_08060 [Candidatus Margulisbacteria bacterium]|jgi:hypothetical protein|nr:hypothetical protein [Candidatus Margulisiibacteriota bacterium]